MGHRSPTLPELSATAPSETPEHCRADVESHLNIDETHQEQLNDTAYAAQMDVGESQVMHTVASRNEIHAHVSGAAISRQASLPTVILQGTLGEEQGRATQASENVSAFVRHGTVP